MRRSVSLLMYLAVDEFQRQLHRIEGLEEMVLEHRALASEQYKANQSKRNDRLKHRKKQTTFRKKMAEKEKKNI